MKLSLWARASLGLLLDRALARPAPSPVRERAASVTVLAAAGSVIGSSSGGVETFNGIPFAKPPVGVLRLKPPVRLTTTFSDFDATGSATACPQMFLSDAGTSAIENVLATALTLPILEVASGQEDCLTVNVQRPAGTAADAGLPVLFWIFGGGFELGSTGMYDGASLVAEGVSLGMPFVFVAVNYRVGGFGFMPGSQLKAEGSSNAGLLDQRMGLQWVADNVAAFGGDPDKVTIWGESAGAISVADQLMLYGGDIAYNGKALFRGAIMNSGSIVPAEAVDSAKGQAVFDAVAGAAGCGSAADVLACLRALDYTAFLQATNSVPGLLSYSSVALSYLPRPDGTVLPESPELLVAAGKYAAVPMIVGDQEDEGTLFSLFQPNLSSTADVVGYLSSLFFSQASEAQLKALLDTYSTSVLDGSPFRTGLLNELYPGFKRLAALLGDLVFTLTRRAFLTSTAALNPGVPSWSYLSSYDYGTPVLGTFHGSDLLQVFYGILPDYASKSIQTYYINFLYNLDPNVGNTAYMDWPQWSTGQQLMNFFNDDASLLADDFRSESYAWITSNIDVLHV